MATHNVGPYDTDSLYVQLIEIVIDLGRKPVARFLHGEAQLSGETVSQEFLEMVVSQVSNFASLTGTHLANAAQPATMPLSTATSVYHCGLKDTGTEPRSGGSSPNRGN